MSGETTRVLRRTSRVDLQAGAKRSPLPRAMRGALWCFVVTVASTLGTFAPASASSGVPRQASAATMPTTYVTNSQSDVVTVVSGTSIARKIRVDNGPVGIALTPDRKMAYVADYGFFNEPSQTVTPLNLATRKAGKPIVVGTGPMAVAVDSTQAVVTLEGTSDQPGHQIVVIDLASRTVSAPVDVGLNPESLALSPDGKTAYVAAFGSAQVTPVNLVASPPRAESPIPLPGTSPRAIAISKDGTTAYVLDATSATVIPINLVSGEAGTPVALHCSKMGDPGCTPTAITITKDGKDAYIAAAGSADVLELSVPGLDVVKVLPAGGYPDALGLIPGWLFVANGASNDLTVFHHGTRSVSPFSYPFGVAVVPGTAGGSRQADGPTDPAAPGRRQPPAGARIIPTGPPPPFYGVPVG